MITFWEAKMSCTKGVEGLDSAKKEARKVRLQKEWRKWGSC